MRTVSEQVGPVAPPRWLRGPWRWLVLALAAAFFFAPVGVRVFGVRAKPIENRPLVAFPPLSRGFHIFADLTQWSIDHLPLRKLAVRTNARLSEDLFGEPPTYNVAGAPVGIGQGAALAGGARPAPGGSFDNMVISGSHGWLFLGDEFVRGCTPDFTLTQFTAALRRLDTIVTASGRKLVLIVAPDKDTVDQRFVSSSTPFAACSRQAKAERWAALGALGLPDFVDLLPRLQVEERTTGQPSFLALDSHWSDRSSTTVFVKSMLDALSPSLYASARVAPGPRQAYTGDLSVLNGAPMQGSDVRWLLTRPGVAPGATTTTTPFLNFPITHYVNAARPGVPLVRPHTLLYGDSFSVRALDQIAPFFADLTYIPEVSRGAVEGPQARAAAIAALAEQIRSADVVVVEQAERELVSAVGSILAPDVLDALQSALAKAPRGRGLSVR
ncbi:MAG: alginate O-acetyltransferase AlgX-related protein [Solirubrobacteraceae bacterium]|nr:MAG: hypothetical protein DLM63_08560 [Solirubrobacterales bacterium]